MHSDPEIIQLCDCVFTAVLIVERMFVIGWQEEQQIIVKHIAVENGRGVGLMAFFPNLRPVQDIFHKKIGKKMRVLVHHECFVAHNYNRSELFQCSLRLFDAWLLCWRCLDDSSFFGLLLWYEWMFPTNISRLKILLFSVNCCNKLWLHVHFDGWTNLHQFYQAIDTITICLFCPFQLETFYIISIRCAIRITIMDNI